MSSSAPSQSVVSSFLYGSTHTGAWLADLILLGARLYAGITIASAGADKLPTPDWMTDQVASIGFPAPGVFATVACLTEFVGGILLAVGFLTRPMALLLAFTMGVASFGFHKLTPIVDMHIAQGFVWLFAAFLAVGAGRLSLDTLIRTIQRSTSPRSALAPLLGVPVLAASLGFGLYREFVTPPTALVETTQADITSVSLAGTFNDWDLGAAPLTLSDGVWSAEVQIEQPGPMQFKFAANNSWDLSVGVSDSTALRLPVASQGTTDSGNIVVIIPEAGLYRFSINSETYEFSVRSTSDGNDS
jgi:putative oxidoreductase